MSRQRQAFELLVKARQLALAYRRLPLLVALSLTVPLVFLALMRSLFADGDLLACLALLWTATALRWALWRAWSTTGMGPPSLRLWTTRYYAVAVLTAAAWMESVAEVGGEVVIYAPHLDVVSPVHGKYIYQVGYHILPYFLNDWDRFKDVPLGVLAHSTHVRGSCVMENGIEKPNVRVTLASIISPTDCARLNLGYLDPARIVPAEWQNREDEGILYVAKAGEMLYKVRSK